MLRLRCLFLDHARWAALLIVVALAMKLLVPAGFMPMLVDGRVVVAPCSGTGPMTVASAEPGMAGHHGGGHHHDPKDAGQHEDKHQPCAFAGLMTPSLAAADPDVLAFAIAFVLALGRFLDLSVPARRSLRLRPPLRGPPVPA